MKSLLSQLDSTDLRDLVLITLFIATLALWAAILGG